MVLRIRPAEVNDLETLAALASEQSAEFLGQERRGIEDRMRSTCEGGKSHNYLVIEEEAVNGDIKVTDILGFVAMSYDTLAQRITINGPVLHTYNADVAAMAIVSAEDLWKRRIAATGTLPTQVRYVGTMIVLLQRYGYESGADGYTKDLRGTRYVRTHTSFTIQQENTPLS